MTLDRGYLLLENGMRFEGKLPLSQEGICVGEVVFTTGMTGYVESLTDPSYTGQILNFTFPLIGNYGVPSKGFWESSQIHVKGVILSEIASFYSHFQAEESLKTLLNKQGVFLLTGIDTRALTQVLRKGSLKGVIGKHVSKEDLGSHISYKVKCGMKKIHGKGKKRVMLVDYGMKQGILNQLLKFPLEVVQVPSDYNYLNDEFDALFLSNGPGDPESYSQEISFIREAMKREVPIFGVCLGCQLLGLAGGAKTYKLKYGHRGQNNPCIEEKSQKCYITSQNHGYAIERSSLKKGWQTWFSNLNDKSVEGIYHEYLPFSAVQFHPEAAPGPQDTMFLFERFYQLCAR